MPNSTKPKAEKAEKAEKSKLVEEVALTLKVSFTTYPYPCALCGKAQVSWTVIDKVTTLKGWATIPLKHEVCGQEIELSIKVEDLLK